VGTVRDEANVVGAGAPELAVANGAIGKCAAAQAFDGEGVTSKNADGSENTIYEGLLDGNLSAAELQHRISVLYEVERRLEESGPHVARPDPARARQFMPFAALKGYHEMALSQENPLSESYEEVDEGL
jgi:hypothetical protein